MGVDGLFASIVTVIQAFALLWIVVIAAAAALVARMFVKARQVEWVRGQDEIERIQGRLQDTEAKHEGRPGAAA